MGYNPWKYPFIESMADLIYGWLQYLDENHAIARRVKRMVKCFIRCIKKVSDGALALDYDTIICGHTHFATQKRFNGRDYYNAGSWVQRPGTYVDIDGFGNVLLKSYNGS